VNSHSISLSKRKEIQLFSINTRRNAWITWIFSLSMRILISSLKTRKIWINSALKQLLWRRNSKFNQLNHIIKKRTLKSGISQRTSRMKLKTWKKNKSRLSTFAWTSMIKWISKLEFNSMLTSKLPRLTLRQKRKLLLMYQ